MGCLSNGGCERNKIWHEGSLGDEQDARTLNTRVAQRKHAISYSMMNNNCNSIECCSNTHQEWHVPTNALALRTLLTLVTLLVIFHKWYMHIISLFAQTNFRSK